MKLVIEKSSETQRQLKTAITGNSGTGKTYGALLFASVWEKLKGTPLKIGVIDTENYSTSNLKAHVKFSLIDINQDEVDFNTYVEAIKMLLNDGCDFLIVDSITPAWNGEKGVLGNINKITNGKSASPQQWAICKRSNKLLVNFLCSLKIPVIATVRSRDTMKMKTVENIDKTNKSNNKSTIIGQDYGKAIQDKEFLSGFDLVCQLQKEVYLFPNGSIFTYKDITTYADEKKMFVDDFIRVNNLQTLQYYCLFNKSRCKELGELVLFNNLFIAKIYYWNNGLDFSKSIYGLHPELFSQFKDANSLIHMLKQSQYNFYKNDINLIEALYYDFSKKVYSA